MNYTVYQDFGHKGLIGETVHADFVFLEEVMEKLDRITKLVQINF